MVTQSEESITLNDVLPAFLTTTADPSHSFRMTFYRPLSLRTGGRKRIFILFFCVVPPSQYPPSGFAGHLLINKEAYPIPILSVRIPFLNTAANPLLLFRMTPNGNHMLRLLTHSSQLTADSSQLIAFIFLPSPLITVTDPSHSFRMTFYRPLSLRTGGAEKESSFYSFASFPQASILRPAPPATSL